MLAVVALIVTAITFYKYINTQVFSFIVIAIISLIVAIAFGGMFLSGRINKTEDIHITE